MLMSALLLAINSKVLASCQTYDAYFEEAAARYEVPSNLIRAIASHESIGCDQWQENPIDKGCGVMQLTGDTKTGAAQLLGVSEDSLCENTSEGARLNILGGTAVLRSKRCWANPRIKTTADFDNCTLDLGEVALTANEKHKLAETIEPWWFPLSAYNGGGADGKIFTSNYPFRVWPNLSFFASGAKFAYPPEIKYFLNGEETPEGIRVAYDANKEISIEDDLLYPTPSDLQRPGVTGGIRWVNSTYDAFDVVLHRNDGSAYAAGNACQSILSGEPGHVSASGLVWGLPWNWLSAEKELLLSAACSAAETAVTVGSGNEAGEPGTYRGLTYVYNKSYYWENGEGWKQYYLDCAGSEKTPAGGVWCKGQAIGAIPVTAQWFVGWTCIWDGNTYLCGCTDEQCSNSYWQAQGVTQ